MIFSIIITLWDSLYMIKDFIVYESIFCMTSYILPSEDHSRPESSWDIPVLDKEFYKWP